MMIDSRFLEEASDACTHPKYSVHVRLQGSFFLIIAAGKASDFSFIQSDRLVSYHDVALAKVNILLPEIRRVIAELDKALSDIAVVRSVVP